MRHAAPRDDLWRLFLSIFSNFRMDVNTNANANMNTKRKQAQLHKCERENEHEREGHSRLPYFKPARM